MSKEDTILERVMYISVKDSLKEAVSLAAALCSRAELG